MSQHASDTDPSLRLQRSVSERTKSPDGPLPIRPARRRSLPQEIVAQLFELIASHPDAEYRLPPERTLCSQLGVSRASLREAFAALHHLGVVETRGKTKYGRVDRARAQLVGGVAAADSRERVVLTDPLEVRRMLEPEIAAKAAKRSSEQVLDEIERWNHLMEEAVRRGERPVEYDSAFHVSIARGTGNQTLVQLVAALIDSLRESRELSFVPEDSATRALQGHWDIVKALRARDPRGARRAMKKHLDEVEALIRSHLGEASAHGAPPPKTV